MKRFFVRLLALGILVAAGLIAIAQAQRGSQAGEGDAGFDPFQGAAAPSSNRPNDPFAGVRSLSERPHPPEANNNRYLVNEDRQPAPRRLVPGDTSHDHPHGADSPPVDRYRDSYDNPPGQTRRVAYEAPAGDTSSTRDPFANNHNGSEPTHAPPSNRDNLAVAETQHVDGPTQDRFPTRVGGTNPGADRYGDQNPPYPPLHDERNSLPQYEPSPTAGTPYPNEPPAEAGPRMADARAPLTTSPPDSGAPNAGNRRFYGNAETTDANAAPTGAGRSEPFGRSAQCCNVRRRQCQRAGSVSGIDGAGGPAAGNPASSASPFNRVPAPLQGTGRPGERALEGAQVPSLQVQKLAPAEIQVGKPATFEILVRNLGKSTARDVQVRDNIPKGTEFISATPPPQVTAEGELIWTLDALNPGDERVLKMELLPTTEGEIGSVATVTFAARASVRSIATRPELRVEVISPSKVMIGDEVTLKIKVWNPGTGPASGVVVSEHVPPGLIHPAGGVLEYEVGDLKPGDSRELELTLQANKSGQIANVVNVRAEGTLRAEGRTQIEVISPALEVVLNGPKKRFLERQATYTIEVSNPGTAPAKDVSLVSYIPKGLRFVNADNYGTYDPQSGAVHWSLEELPANQRGVVTLNVLPVEAGQHMISVEGAAQHDLAARGEHTVEVEGVSAIHFQVVDMADPVEVGEETAYEIRVVNQGSKVATNVEVAVTLPQQLQAISADGPVRGVIQGNRIVFEALDRLAPRADTTYRVRVRGNTAGDLRTEVQLKTSEMDLPVTKEESTRVYADQ